jgi:hypothetical protein
LIFENFQAQRIKEVINKKKKKLKINEPLNIGRNHFVKEELASTPTTHPGASNWCT